jgi:hypothetical protein
MMANYSKNNYILNEKQFEILRKIRFKSKDILVIFSVIIPGITHLG